jgi:hypothetical protein
VPPNEGAAVNDYICGGGPVSNIWVNQTSVRKALNVPVNSYFFSGDNGKGMTYIPTQGQIQFYREVAANTTLKVLVYNGDADPGINSMHSENWTVALGFEETEPWRAWTMDGCRRVGGYVTRYEKARLDYVTIRSSGHMVPQFKPAQTLEFMRAWLKGEDYKRYVASCTKPTW